MKKLVLQLAGLGILIAGLFPVAALADPTALGYTWKDIQTIESPSGHVFHDPDWTNDPHAYIDTSASLPGCKLKSGSTYGEYNVAQLIDITDWGKKGSGTLVTFTLDKKTPNNTTCTETSTSITIDNPALAGAQYDRIDATTIKALRADSPDGQDNSTYTFNPTTKTFVQNNPGSNCHTTISVYSDGRGALITHSTETGPGRLSSTSSGYTYANGCWVQKVGTYSLLGYPENASKAGGTGGGGAGGPPSAEDVCANDPSTGAFAWIICPAITSVTKVMNDIYDNFIKPSLQVDPLGKNPNLKEVWAQFRNVADVLFVLVFLMVIFSTVTNVGVSSYTIKKVLPRLVAAAILVQFSWFICGFAIDIGNVLGAGISSLVNYALSGAKLTTGTNTTDSLNMLMSNTAVLGLMTAGAVVGVGALIIAGPTLLFLLLGLLISLITLAATLVVRLLVLKVLIVLAPIAIVLWVLPNTESLFKKWYQNFTKLILMFPIIALLIAGGQIVQAAGTADKNNAFQELAAILAPMIAFFLIPATFKMAGTMMGTVSGAIAKRGSALSSRAQNSQVAKDMQASHKARGYQRLNSPDSGVFGRAIGRVQSGNGTSFGSAGRMRAAAGYQAVQSAQMKDTTAQFDSQQTGTDDLLAMGMGQDVAGFKNNEFTQAAAIQRLAERGQQEQLFQIKDELDKKKKAALAKGTKAGNNESLSYERIFNSGIGSSKGDLLRKAPELVKGAGLSYNTMSASNVASMGAPSLTRAMEHLSAPLDPKDYDNVTAYNDDVTKRAAGRAILESSVQQLFASPRLKTEMSPVAAKALYDSASGGTSLDTEIRKGINPDGTFK